MTEVLKKCSQCKEESPRNNFPRHSSYKDGYYAYCKKCRNEKQKQWRKDNPEQWKISQEKSQKRYKENNPDKVKEMSKQSYKNNKALKIVYLQKYLKEHPCIDCGNKDLRVLEFDHCYGKKTNNISRLTYSTYTLNALQEEILKCEVRCANCHKIKTISELKDCWRNY